MNPMIYNAPEVKVLAALANIAATSVEEEEEDDEPVMGLGNCA
mgnify:CR=1 FL=1